jgi:hypothetical protein
LARVTPPIPLTSRAMLGTRLQTRLPAGLRLALLAVSALLAFACFPALAAAAECEGDSSQIEYCDAPPQKIERNEPHSNNKATPGNTRDGDQSATDPGSDDESGSDRKKSNEDSAGGGGGKNGGKGDGQAQAGKKGDGAEKGQAKPIGFDPASTDDDSSSPLVPILIALAVLAAISIGVVAMRRRRQDADPGSPASPEAG